jgi:hypothetical protein
MTLISISTLAITEQEDHPARSVTQWLKRSFSNCTSYKHRLCKVIMDGGGGDELGEVINSFRRKTSDVKTKLEVKMADNSAQIQTRYPIPQQVYSITAAEDYMISVSVLRDN